MQHSSAEQRFQNVAEIHK